MVTKKYMVLKNSKMLEKLIKDIYKGDMAVDKAEIKQNEFLNSLMN